MKYMQGHPEYAVKTPEFEGPLDLLLYLVKKNDMDIYNIPISLITDEYLNYLEMMEQFDIDYAAEFLYMAATLADIKAKMLLPSDEADGENDEDPRLEIVRPLEAYLLIKAAGEELMAGNIIGRDVFLRTPDTDATRTWFDLDPDQLSLYSLLSAYREITEKNYDPHKIIFDQESISVKERISQICSLLEKKGGTLFHDLTGNRHDIRFIVTTFLALLEMAKLKLIRLTQINQDSCIQIDSL